MALRCTHTSMRILKTAVASLAGAQDQITGALDFLFQGY